MSARSLQVLSAVALLSFTGCTDTEFTPTSTREILSPSVLVTEYDRPLLDNGYITEATIQDAHELARGIALSLADPTSRIRVRDAMRGSPFVEHKLVLQSFLQSKGTDLRGTLSQYINVDRVLSQLPEMDFYLPFDQHRYNWKATPDIMVGVHLNVDSPLFIAYDLSGNQHEFDARDGSPSQFILFLHPAEKKALHGKSHSPGEVVEDAPTDTRSPLTPAQYCDPESDPSCGGGSGGSGGAVLSQFVVFHGDGVGDTEPEFTFRYYSLGDLIYFKHLPYGNKKRGVWHPVNDLIWPIFYFDGDIVEVRAIENDQFMNDDWGFGSIESIFDPFRIQTYTPCNEVGDPPPDPCPYSPAIVKGVTYHNYTTTAYLDYVAR